MSRFGARASAFQAPPPRAAVDAAASRAIFHTLASAAAIESADSQAAAAELAKGGSTCGLVPSGMLERHLDHPNIPGIGLAIVRVAFSGAESFVNFKSFVRGIELFSCASNSTEQLLDQLWQVLSSCVDSSIDESTMVSAILMLAFRLDSCQNALPADSDEAFHCAAASATIEMARREGPMSTRFGVWAASALPGLAALMGNYVERMCDASEGLDAAAQLHLAPPRHRTCAQHSSPLRQRGQVARMLPTRQIECSSALLDEPSQSSLRLRHNGTPRRCQQAMRSDSCPGEMPALRWQRPSYFHQWRSRRTTRAPAIVGQAAAPCYCSHMRIAQCRAQKI